MCDCASPETGTKHSDRRGLDIHAHAYMRAFQQRCCFLLSQVSHVGGGNAQKMLRIKDEITVRRKTIKRISFSHSIEFWGRNHYTVKIHLKYILINCCIDVYHEDCDTCDSKKAKTSVRTRVCARVREGDYKDFHNFFLFILLCSIETTRCFKQNDTSFYEKHHVVL